MANNTAANYENFLVLTNIGNELEKLSSRLNLIHTLMVVVCLGVVVIFIAQAGFALYYLAKIKRRPELPTELIIKDEDKKKRRSKKKSGGSRKSSKSTRSSSQKSGKSGKSGRSQRSGKRSEKSEENSPDSAKSFPSKEAKIQIDFEPEEKKKKDLETPPTIEVTAMPPPPYQPQVDPITLRQELKNQLVAGAAPNYQANSSISVEVKSEQDGDLKTAKTASATNTAVAPITSATTAIAPATPTKTAVEPQSPLPKTAISISNTKTAIGPSTPIQNAK